MTLNEAQEKFPLGSLVKIKEAGYVYSIYDKWAALYLSTADYLEWAKRGIFAEDGDAGIVIAVAPHLDIVTHSRTILVAVKVKGKKPFIIEAEGLETIFPPFNGTVLPGIADIDEEGKSYRASFNGTALVVVAHGETAIFNVEKILDELNDECRKKAQEIKVGDMVEITDCYECYPCHIDWLKENATFDQALMFDWDNSPKTGDNAKVLAIAPREEHDTSLLYLVEIEHDDVHRIYLMDRDGIKKI